MADGINFFVEWRVNGEKKKQDFDARLESARALLAAQQRIVKEKGAGREAQDVARSIESQLEEAQKLAAAGRDDEGRALLDRAYLTARVSIESLLGPWRTVEIFAEQPGC